VLPIFICIVLVCIYFNKHGSRVHAASLFVIIQHFAHWLSDGRQSNKINYLSVMHLMKQYRADMQSLDQQIDLKDADVECKKY